MRSFILPAAIAAILASTSFSLAGGGSIGDSSAGSGRSMGDVSTGGGTSTGDASGHGAASRSTFKLLPSAVAPAAPTSFGMIRPQTRLAQIKAQLNAAATRIATERRNGELTTEEARRVRQEETAISEAVQGVSNRDEISDATYTKLQSRISKLDGMIQRYASN
jgi:hypothetical protein